jgi:L-asparagine transporter-like permease
MRRNLIFNFLRKLNIVYLFAILFGSVISGIIVFILNYYVSDESFSYSIQISVAGAIGFWIGLGALLIYKYRKRRKQVNQEVK